MSMNYICVFLDQLGDECSKSKNKHESKMEEYYENKWDD